jgi:hypothetical protein
MNQYSDHLDAEVERADERIRDTGARVSAHLGRNGPVTGRATSPNGAVTVSVRPGGKLVELRFESVAFTLRPEQLAAEIVAVAQRATRDADARMHRSLGPVVSREVADSLTSLGAAPAPAADEDVDWVKVIRGNRDQR